MIDAYPRRIAYNSTSMVVAVVPPNRPVTWSLTGTGTLTQADAVSNSQGVAKAILAPTAADQIMEVSVSYVP